MGVSDSKGGSFSRDPVKFGEAGEVGGMVGVYHDHNLTIPRDRVTERRDSVVTISREFLDLYNRVTGTYGWLEWFHHVTFIFWSYFASILAQWFVIVLKRLCVQATVVSV